MPNSRRRDYYWYRDPSPSGVRAYSASSANTGIAVAGARRLDNQFLYSRTDSVAANSRFGGTLGLNGVLDFSAGDHFPRYEYASNVLGGLVLESGITNRLYLSRTFATSGAAITWTTNQLNGAGVLAATGPDNTLSAVVLTSTSANGHIHQARGNLGTGNRIFSVWLRCPGGNTTVLLTLNNFSTTSSITVTPTWQRFSMSMASGSVTCGFRVVANNTTIHAFGPQLRVATSLGSECISDSNDVGTGPDLLFVESPDMPTAGSILLELRARSRYTPAFQNVITLNWEETTEATYSLTSTGVGSMTVAGSFLNSSTGGSGSTTASGAFLDTLKIAVAYREGLIKSTFSSASGVSTLSGVNIFTASDHPALLIGGNDCLVASVQVLPYVVSDSYMTSFVAFPPLVPPEQ